ncbi:MAG: outer membrane beta-barrel protein, partial [Archangium sp.]
GGAGGFTGALGKITAPGLMFGVTADARPWRLMGIEGSYEFQRLPIDDARVGNEQAMYRHDVNLMAKAGPQLLDDKLRPYVGAGLGLSYLNASDGADTLYRNDWIWELPLAAGADYYFTKAIFAGARASYHILYGEEFANSAAEPNQNTGNLLNFNLALGGRF